MIFTVIYNQYLGPLISRHFFHENVRYSLQSNWKWTCIIVDVICLNMPPLTCEDKALIKVLQVEKGWNVDHIISTVLCQKALSAIFTFLQERQKLIITSCW